MRKSLYSKPLRPEGGLALVRVITGLFMAYHGWEVFDAETMKGYFDWDAFKKFSSPSFMAYMGKTFELIAGILLLAGLFTRLATLLIIGTMTYISFFVGHGKIWYDDQYPFLFVLLALVFFFTGSGPYSLDRLFFRKNKY